MFLITAVCLIISVFVALLNGYETLGTFYLWPNLLISLVAGGGAALCLKYKADSQKFLWVLLGIPIALYFINSFIYARNFPYEDDLGVIVKFLWQFLDEKSWIGKFNLFVEKNSDHREFWVKIPTLIQYGITGSVNFKVLTLLGQCSYLAIAALLWLSFNPKYKKLFFIVPAAYLLFQFRHYEEMYWAMAILSGFLVLPVCLSTLYLLLKGLSQNRFFAFSCILGFLAVFTQANGKLVFPIGALILLQSRKYRKLGVWLLIGTAASAFEILYKSHTFTQHQPLHKMLAYPAPFFYFLGSILPVWRFYSYPLGVLLAFYFGYLTWIRYDRKNPFFYYSLALIILNALGVWFSRAGGSDYPPRYTMYSSLFVTIAYLTWVEVLQERSTPVATERFARWAYAFVIPVNLASYYFLSLLMGFHYATDVNYSENTIAAASGLVSLKEKDPSATVIREVDALRNRFVFRHLPSPIRRLVDKRMTNLAIYLIHQPRTFSPNLDGGDINPLVEARNRGFFDFVVHFKE